MTEEEKRAFIERRDALQAEILFWQGKNAALDEITQAIAEKKVAEKMTEEEFDALAKLPLYDLVDLLRGLGLEVEVEEEPTGCHWPLALRESIQEEWDW